MPWLYWEALVAAVIMFLILLPLVIAGMLLGGGNA